MWALTTAHKRKTTIIRFLRKTAARIAATEQNWRIPSPPIVEKKYVVVVSEDDDEDDGDEDDDEDDG